MICERIPTGGCQSYLLGCPDTRVGIVIDPNFHQIDRYQTLAAHHGMRIRYVLDTHTHADHFSGAREMGQRLNALVVMHRLSPAPHADMLLDEGDTLQVGGLALRAMHTPGHTRDSMCMITEDRIFTGDTLLIGGVGRTDLPTGNPDALYDSLFHRVLKLDPVLKIFPAHDYNNRSHSTLGEELATNPRLQNCDRESFVATMRELRLELPALLTEALRANMHGGKSLCQLLADAGDKIAFLSVEELVAGPDDILLLDVREPEAFREGHIPGALNLPRSRLEWQANRQLPDPSQSILVCCGNGEMAILAAATLREIGFTRAAALTGGIKAWQDKGFALSRG